MTDTAISVTNLTVSYHQTPVLRGITVDIPARQITCIVGPNGAGKSTFLKALIGLEPRDTGEALIFDEPAEKALHRVAYLPQKEIIDWDFPVTVKDVVMMGRYPAQSWWRFISGQDRSKVEESLKQVGIWDLRDRHIRLLSGGQQQRVFIARALVQEADILFMDEPFVGVDATTQETILELIENLREEGKTVVLINHDLKMVFRFDYLMMLNKQLMAAGPPDEVYTEKNYELTYGGIMPIVDEAEQALWRAKR